jgi:predicted DNA-binding protein with PD1-like motif
MANAVQNALPPPVRQPGPATEPRVLALPAKSHPVSLECMAGLSLLESVARAFAAHGATSGVVDIAGLRLDPFAYVIPALATTTSHAAFYSDTREPAGGADILAGKLTFGTRDGQPWLHAHARWRLADGTIGAGHILPQESVVAEPSSHASHALAGAAFEAVLDPETLFTLMRPVARALAPSQPRALAIRLRPNLCLHTALEACAARAGFAQARILGGVGSLVGIAFADGRAFSPFATEVYLTEGMITRQGNGAPEARLSGGFVNVQGEIAEGIFARGRSRVLMTFELVLAEAGA